MSKVRHPDNFESEITIAVENATKAEVLVPFETMPRAKAFRQRIYDFVRSHKAHGTDFSKRIPRVSVRIYTSIDVALTHHRWNPGPLFPYTVVIDCRQEFSANLANMELSESPREPIPRTDRDPTGVPAPILDDDPPYEYRDDQDNRASVFSDIMKGLGK